MCHGISVTYDVEVVINDDFKIFFISKTELVVILILEFSDVFFNFQTV